MRHVEKTLHYSFVNLFVTRLASTFSHFAKESLLSREESKHGIVDDNRWKGRVNLGLWECRYFGWNPFTSDNTSSLNDASDVNGSICRQVSPRYNSSITHIRTHTRTHTHIHTWLFGTRRMRERTGVRALAMGHQLLVTGSAYAIEPNEIVNGPEWTGCGCRIERP